MTQPDRTIQPTQITQPGRTGIRARLRRRRVWILLGLVLCVVVILGVLSRPAGQQVRLSPASPAPEGAMAAAEILAGRGVNVHQPESFDAAVAALEARPGDSTLLLLDPDGYLDADRLESIGGLAGRLVLVEPSFQQLVALAPGIRSGGLLAAGEETTLTAQCAVADAAAAGTISAGGLAYRAAETCFPPPAGDDGTGALALDDGGRVLVLGNSAVLTNEGLAAHGNAALALRTLGAHENLVWYQTTPADIAAADLPSDPRALLPGWVDPLLLWLLVVAVLAIFWRGRRLGPLAVEPMPVTVRSSETAEGRARLYQDGRAVERAAGNFRAAALTRLAARLRLGPGTTPDQVAAAAARATGRSPGDVHRLLNRPLPSGEAALVEWAQDLHDLEEEVTAP